MQRVAQCWGYTGRHCRWLDGLNDDKALTMAKKTGRPPFPYTEELADEICGAIASNSVGITKLRSNNPHWPSRETIYQWLATKPGFADNYARAKANQISLLVDEIIEIADDTGNDAIITETGNRVANHEFIARSRLRIDARKWLASKLQPTVYGVGADNKSLHAGINHEEMLKSLAYDVEMHKQHMKDY